nr:MAG TPA: hypothetical protein [Caudoviricetes sp.]
MRNSVRLQGNRNPPSKPVRPRKNCCQTGKYSQLWYNIIAFRTEMFNRKETKNASN